MKEKSHVAIDGPGLPDLLHPALDVVFVGYNPSLPAWRTGHYYANPTNSFYRLLCESRLTPRLLRPEEDGLLLGLGVGAIDLLAGRPSARAGDLPDAEYRRAREGLRLKLERTAPRVVCFNGLGVYAHYFGEKPEGLGLQERRIAESLVYVVPSSSGAANARTSERREAWLALGALVRALRSGVPSRPVAGFMITAPPLAPVSP